MVNSINRNSIFDLAYLATLKESGLFRYIPIAKCKSHWFYMLGMKIWLWHCYIKIPSET